MTASLLRFQEAYCSSRLSIAFGNCGTVVWLHKTMNVMNQGRAHIDKVLNKFVQG